MKTVGVISPVSGVRSKILFELFNSGGGGGVFSRTLPRSRQYCLSSFLLETPGDGEGVNLDMCHPKPLKGRGLLLTTLSLICGSKLQLCDHVSLKNVQI